MFVMNGESYEIDEPTINLWGIYCEFGEPSFESSDDYLKQFKKFCEGIIKILKTEKE